MYGIQNDLVLQIKAAKRLILKIQNSELFSLQLKKLSYKNKLSDQKGCQNNKYQEFSSPFVSMIRKQIYHSHKMTLWMEEPTLNSQSEESNQGRLRRHISFTKEASKYYLQHGNEEQTNTSISLCCDPMDSYLVET